MDVVDVSRARRMRKHIVEECIEDIGLAFRFDFESVVTGVADKSMNVITCRDARHSVAKPHALDGAADSYVTPLAQSLLKVRAVGALR
jgi:hypothetical protein